GQRVSTPSRGIKNTPVLTGVWVTDRLDFNWCQKLMSRKGDEILAIYGYSRISTSNQDYKTQIQTLENAGAEIIFLENHWIIEHLWKYF
ncbi:hypothetical protein, partial [Enterococcus faecium]